MSKTVANRSPASAAMVTATAKGRALMGGTDAMRKARTTYLPRFEKESVTAYEVRLAGSWLFNGYRKTVRDMTGRVFSEPVELEDGAPEQLETWCENVDLQGRDLSTFARQVFEDAIAGPGIAYIMADAPPRQGTVTQAQAQRENLRPYLVHLRAEDVLGWRTEVVANVTTLVQIRIAETYTEPNADDEFDQKERDQVRVLDLVNGRVQVRIFRRGGRDAWVVVDEYMTDAPAITVVPFYANRTGFFTGLPLLDDLADINIAHWQSQSDQRNILRAARVPILFGKAVPAKDIVIGSNTAILADSADADIKWVEHSGAAIGAGRQDLKDLEFQMETFGLQLLVQRGQQSATGEAIDANKETSILAMTADELKDALEQALQWMCDFGGLAYSPSVEVNKDFGVSFMTAQEVTALLAAVNDGVISRKTFIEELTRRGVLRSDVSADEEAEQIDEEDVGGSETDTLGLIPGLPGQRAGRPTNSGTLN